jgi:SCF-associated factor 1
MGGRLGYASHDVEEEYKTDSEFKNGVCLPRSVPGLEKLIVSDVVGFGYGFAILTGEGDIYKIGELQDYVPRGVNRTVRPVPNIGPTVAPNIPLIGFQIPRMPHFRGPPAAHIDRPEATIRFDGEGSARFGAESKPENDFVDYVGSFTISEKSKAKKLDYYSKDKVRFVTISCGRSHILALDENNNIYIWDQTFVAPGIRLTFPFTKNGVTNKVRKLAAGWNFSSALIDNVGIVVWFEHELQPLPETYSEIKADKQSNKSVEVTSYAVIPLTNQPANSDDSIIDIMAGDNFLVYLTKKGDLYKFNIPSNHDTILTHSAVKLDLFTKKLDELSNGNGQFVKISGTYQYFAVLSDSEHVFIGSKHFTVKDMPIIIDELQKVGCISIATGDYHFLALLRGGKLLSWGRESQTCGSLGQGKFSDSSKRGMIKDGWDLILPKPQEIQIKDGGHVLAIGAGGWQSCAIITTEAIE